MAATTRDVVAVATIPWLPQCRTLQTADDVAANGRYRCVLASRNGSKCHQKQHYWGLCCALVHCDGDSVSQCNQCRDGGGDYVPAFKIRGRSNHSPSRGGPHWEGASWFLFLCCEKMHLFKVCNSKSTLDGVLCPVMHSTVPVAIPRTSRKSFLLWR